jgi:WD40 repeat protein
MIVTSGSGGVAFIWNSHDGGLVRQIPGTSKRIHSTAFSASSDKLAVIGDDKTISIWNLRSSSSEPKTFPNPAASYRDMSFFVARDSRLVVYCGETNQTYLYNAADGSVLASMAGYPASMTTNAEGSARETFLMIPHDGGMELRDAKSGTVLRKITDPMDSQSELSTASFLSDRGLALLGRGDGTIELWDAVNGVELVKFKAFEGRVNSAVFVSPAGKRAIATSPDGTVRVLDLEVGMVLSVLRGHTGPVVNVATSRDGRLAITQGNENSVRLWDLPPASPEKRDLVDLVCHDLLLRTNEDTKDDLAHLTSEERATAPSVDPIRDFKVEGDVCSPVSPWRRLLGALGRE